MRLYNMLLLLFLIWCAEKNEELSIQSMQCERHVSKLYLALARHVHYCTCVSHRYLFVAWGVVCVPYHITNETVWWELHAPFNAPLAFCVKCIDIRYFIYHCRHQKFRLPSLQKGNTCLLFGCNNSLVVFPFVLQVIKK